MSLHIARLDRSHLSAYRALMLHAYAAAPDAFTSTPDERAALPDAWWADRLADPGRMASSFGAFADGGLMGSVTMEYAQKPKTRHKAHLVGMFVAESARGSGAARALVDAALADASARPGVEVVTLTVTQGNAPAEALYRRCGFEVFGVEPMAMRGEDGFKAKLHMWLRLPSAPP